jgi:HEAT repeat protein
MVSDYDQDPDELQQQFREKSTGELLQIAPTASNTDDAFDPGWMAIMELHSRATREVFDAARTLCESPDPVERSVGVAILAQLGQGQDTRPYLEETLDIFFKLIDTEQSSVVLNEVGMGLGHIDDPRKVTPLLRLKNHPDAAVRFGAVFGLMGEEDPQAIQALIELSSDEDGDVRDWATFGLGSQIDADTLAIREALFRRATDLDDDSNAPGEGLAGLAHRNDPRTFELILTHLEAGNVGTLIFEAAETLAHPGLYAALVKLRDDQDYGDYERGCLEDAIAACNVP